MTLPSQEFIAALARVSNLTDELSAMLNILGTDLRRSADPRAKRTAAMSGGASNAAKLLGAAVGDISSIVINEAPSGTNVYYGFKDDFTFAGGMQGEQASETITGLPWITAGSRIIPINLSGPRTSAVETFIATFDNIVPGVGFDFHLMATDSATIAGSDYSAMWFSFG